VLISRDGRVSPPGVQTVASLGEFSPQDP
jgi:hypothetical protein